MILCTGLALNVRLMTCPRDDLVAGGSSGHRVPIPISPIGASRPLAGSGTAETPAPSA